MEKPHIKVWPWGDAPEELTKRFSRKDDMDWLAFVPREIADKEGALMPSWFDRLDAGENPEYVTLPDKSFLVGGGH